jgi:hypothetical protein
VQGSSERSLLQEPDREEHSRLRKHMNAFFTPDNVEAVYTTLRGNALRMAQDLSQEGRGGWAAEGVKNGKNGPDSEAPGVAVDAWHFSHELINRVVMQALLLFPACCASGTRRLRNARASCLAPLQTHLATGRHSLQTHSRAG